MILAVMLCTAVPAWEKARDNLEWEAVGFGSKNRQMKILLLLLISDDEFPRLNKQIKIAVNQLKVKIVWFILLAIVFGILLSFVIYDEISGVYLLIPIVLGITILACVSSPKKLCNAIYEELDE